MNKNELYEVLLNFPKSKDNVILLDGKWGSGKTYLLNEFIKKYKEHLVYYVSLLSKRSVDDINTSLYIEVNKNEVINGIVPSAVSPFKNESSLDHILKIKNEASGIVIFDDLERYGSTNYDELLSYFSNLCLKGIKIIVVSNLSNLGNGERYNFEQYKEKIFDHVYKTDLFETSLLERKLGKYYKYFDSELINELNENIRIVDKTYSFLSSIDKYIDESYLNNEFKMKSLIYYMIYTLRTFYNETKTLYSSLKIKSSEEKKKELFSYLKAEESKWDALKIYEFTLNDESSYKLEDPLLLIAALYDFYLYCKSDLLIKYFKS